MTLLDLLIIAVYLGGIVTVGIVCRGKQDDINDYFTAHGGFKGKMGMVIVGLSLGATFFSGLSFIVYPSIFYTYGITVLSGLIGFPATYLFMRLWFLPRYLARAGRTPYEIIERRFGKPVRLLASAMFVMLRLSWMAALIYAPVIVLMATMGIGEEWLWPLVAVIGLSSTVYTVIGGIRGVIITDAIQFLLIAGALLGTVVYVLMKIPLSFGDFSGFLTNNTHLLHFNWSIDPTVTMTVVTMAVGGSIANLGSFSADQMSLQRYIAAGDARSAAQAFGTSMIATPIVLILLAMVGLAIGTWYSVNPDAGLPTEADKVFPYFVATQLPAGFSGIVIAALLAATMSSVTSGINALSGSLLNDFVPLAERIDPKRLLGSARWLSAAIGLAVTIGAGFVDRLGSLFDIMNALLGVFNGPLLACVLLAVSRLNIHGSILLASMVVGFLAGVGVVNSPLSPVWVTLVSGAVTVVVALLGSRIAQPRIHSTTGRGDNPEQVAQIP